MPIFKINDRKITQIEHTSFKKQKIYERRDLQALLKSNIRVISPDSLVVAEEFGDWEDSNRSIDLLCIDKAANLVVIELKRTRDGGHMDLQAIRYAAMISTLTFEKLIEIYDRYLRKNDSTMDAMESVLSFLDWSEPNEELFGQEVRIVLASADFSKEVTTSVMWLNDFGLDIRCVRMRPYADGNQLLLEVQTVIPLPEIADYQIQIREKRQEVRKARKLSKFNITVANTAFQNLSKRHMMFHLVSEAIKFGKTPDAIIRATAKYRSKLFEILDGELTEKDEVVHALELKTPRQDPRRYFHEKGQFFCSNGKTYVLSDQWRTTTLPVAQSLRDTFPDLNITIDEIEH